MDERWGTNEQDRKEVKKSTMWMVVNDRVQLNEGM